MPNNENSPKMTPKINPIAPYIAPESLAADPMPIRLSLMALPLSSELVTGY